MVRIEYYLRTGQFMAEGPTYHRHCGPTAITNILFTLSARQGRPIRRDPSEVFERVAQIGRNRMTYVNASLFGFLGGTSDFLAPAYIRACLREFGIEGYRARGVLPLSGGKPTEFLDRGAILYLEVHGHPKYGSHHMLCYGYRRDGDRIIYRLADGWASGPVEVPADTLGFALYTAVVPQ